LVRPINDACVSGDQLNLFYHGVLRLGCELGEEAEMQQFRISLFLGAALALQTISIELAGALGVGTTQGNHFTVELRNWDTFSANDGLLAQTIEQGGQNQETEKGQPAPNVDGLQTQPNEIEQANRQLRVEQDEIKRANQRLQVEQDEIKRANQRLQVEQDEIKRDNLRLQAEQDESKRANIRLQVEQDEIKRANIRLQVEQDEIKQANHGLQVEQDEIKRANLRLQAEHDAAKQTVGQLRLPLTNTYLMQLLVAVCVGGFLTYAGALAYVTWSGRRSADGATGNDAKPMPRGNMRSAWTKLAETKLD
jgi:hypothetical protein